MSVPDSSKCVAKPAARNSENRSSASAFVGADRTLATRAQSSRCKGNRLRRTSCLRAKVGASRQYLGIDRSILWLYTSPVRSETQAWDGIGNGSILQPLTTCFTPWPTRLGGKFWSDCLSDQPPSPNWRRRSTCNFHRSCSTSRCSNRADWCGRKSAGGCGRMRSHPDGCKVVEDWLTARRQLWEARLDRFDQYVKQLKEKESKS